MFPVQTAATVTLDSGQSSNRARSFTSAKTGTLSHFAPHTIPNQIQRFESIGSSYQMAIRLRLSERYHWKDKFTAQRPETE